LGVRAADDDDPVSITRQRGRQIGETLQRPLAGSGVLARLWRDGDEALRQTGGSGRQVGVDSRVRLDSLAPGGDGDAKHVLGLVDVAEAAVDDTMRQEITAA